MPDHKPTDKAINRISPELQKSLDNHSPDTTATLKDGKVSCPGCSLETIVDAPADGVRWVSMPATCSKCKTEFRILNDEGEPPKE